MGEKTFNLRKKKKKRPLKKNKYPHRAACEEKFPNEVRCPENNPICRCLYPPHF